MEITTASWDLYKNLTAPRRVQKNIIESYNYNNSMANRPLLPHEGERPHTHTKQVTREGCKTRSHRVAVCVRLGCRRRRSCGGVWWWRCACSPWGSTPLSASRPCSKACPWRTPSLCLNESEQRQWVIELLSLFSDFNTKRFKRTRIYFNSDTQYADFRRNPL